jgi:hypothetical protein
MLVHAAAVYAGPNERYGGVLIGRRSARTAGAGAPGVGGEDGWAIAGGARRGRRPAAKGGADHRGEKAGRTSRRPARCCPARRSGRLQVTAVGPARKPLKPEVSGVTCCSSPSRPCCPCRGASHLDNRWASTGWCCCRQDDLGRVLVTAGRAPTRRSRRCRCCR